MAASSSRSAGVQVEVLSRNSLNIGSSSRMLNKRNMHIAMKLALLVASVLDL